MRSYQLTPTLHRRMALLAFSATALLASASAQAPAPVNRANWKLADRFSNEALRPYLYSTGMTPGWINKGDTFWYSWRDADGIKFWKVDSRAHKKTPLFDAAHMAALLSESTKKPYDTTNLPITTVTFDEKNDDLMRFTVEGTRFEYDLSKDVLKNLGAAPRGGAGTPPAGGQGRGGRGGGGGGQGGPGRGSQTGFRNFSPDRKAYVYAMDDNLYYVEVENDKEKPPVQLTTDGEKYYSFGSKRDQDEQRQQLVLTQQLQQQQQRQQDDQNVDDTSQTGTGAANPNEKRVRANVTWSKDSKRFYVTRRDERKVKDLYLVNSLTEPRPTLMTYRYSMPGEADVPQTELFVFDPSVHRLHKVPVDKYKDQVLMNVHWQDNTSDSFRFVRRDRLQRNLELCEVDLKTDAVKTLLTESVRDTSLEVQPVRYVKPGGDMIWWSERSGWGHYYLYSNDGKLKRTLTSGPFRADRIVDVDADKGTLFFTAVGREAGENPYYHHLYRVNLDGKGLALLDPGDADHASSLSDDKKFVVDVYSRTDKEPTAVLRDESGKQVLELEHMDLSRLKETGWKMPETFKVKAADGVTDIYGNMWKPVDFDPNRKYPIIANVYPGPQTESVSTAFSAAATNQRLAQLGFIVIQIGNRGGNPARSNAYQSYGYYNLRDYGLADKKAGIEQLALRFPWIDIDRVGIYGHSGGGFMTAAALMSPPYNDFFKVGVSSSGNHDNNVYNQNWSEQYHGLKEVPVNPPAASTGGGTGRTPDEEDEWDLGFPDGPAPVPPAAPQGATTTTAGQTKLEIHVPTNAELAPNLKGNLLLVHGDMDNNVHYAGTVRLMNALMRANKRFDFLLIPGKPHGYGDLQPYFTQRMMEYFAEHLLGDRYGSTADMTEHK
ncbi:putative dipeptidyl peptidase [Fimbriimonas ginsengisoli Gsoil 348]|uniref:Putative dipeptidyl peptidase n=2 Tax=Fimbriimonas ginsengisoli TaxID=1005039 RepID=A0A068NMQ7_FIMGI|nr:putative dipeptidyl peptidase [Fimbriimonas ginsengisoli Gsoil 348]